MNIDNIRINPFEGIQNINDWAHHKSPKGDDFNNGRKHTLIAPCNMIIDKVGGPFNQIIGHSVDNGEVIRFAENANILVSQGERVDIFQPIATDALYREAQYKGTHVNGGDEVIRNPFLLLVTHTQAEARAIIDDNIVEPNHRKILGTAIANIRSKPVVKLDNKVGEIPADKEIDPLGYVYGEIRPDGNALWYVVTLDADGWPNGFVWSGGTTDTSPHDLSQMQEKPDIVVVEPPVVVVTPVEELPPVIEAPPIVIPPKNEQPKNEQPPIIIEHNSNGWEKLGEQIGDLFVILIPRARRKKIYNIVSKIGGICSAIGIVSLTISGMIGGEIGIKIAVGSALITAISSGIGALANRLADKNT